jgi:uncharacterized protein (TIGR02118 family)
MGRIKLFAMGVRRSDMSAEDFHDYWRHPHGTWARNMSTLRGYVQSHQIHTDLLGADQARYECVAEVWLDNEKDIDGFQHEPVFVKYLQNDAPNFVDPTQATFFASEEEVLTSGPAPNAAQNPGDELWSLASRPFSVKLLHFIGPDGNPNWASDSDETIGRKLGALRHARCHALPVHNADNARFLGVQELWWPTVRAFRAGVGAAPAALTALVANAGRSVTLLAQAERFL